MDNFVSGSTGGAGESEDIFGSQQWAFGYTAAMQSSLDGGLNPQVDMHSTSQMSSPPLNVQPCQGSKGSSSKPPKAANVKKVARRGGAFTKEEDLVICSAFLNVSKDPITGVNQTSGGYYKRMHDYFNEHKPQGSNRSHIAVQHRWAFIQRSMSKFCAHKTAIDRMNQSGKNEQDRIDDAVKMYEMTEPFTIMHCWKQLCNEPKWNNKFLELNNRTPPAAKPSPPTQCHADSGNDNTNVSRPPQGRDAAKRSRAESSSSSAAVEVLQRLQEKSERTEEKQGQQMAEILNRKDEKIKLQRDQINLQKKHFKLKMQQQKRESKIREKESEAQLLTAESNIMSVDTDKVPPHLKGYYVGMQQEIMKRRGFNNPSNNQD